jgi:hypothetical protein
VQFEGTSNDGSRGTRVLTATRLITRKAGRAGRS